LAVVVVGIVGAVGLVGASGTALPMLLVAAPVTRFPGSLLGISLLGMTALRCALVLSSLAAERLPERLGIRRRRLAAQLPAGLAVAVSFALLWTDAASFTKLITVGGGSAALLISVVLPAWLAQAGSRERRAGQRLRASHTAASAALAGR
jgi:hypothetical protein